MLAGPALGGVLIGAFGVTVTFGIDLATFLISLGFLAAMRASPPAPGADRPSLRSIGEGLRYASSRPELLGTYLVDVNAMFFGMPQALFPAIAAGYGGAEVLGLLYAAPAAGSIVVALLERLDAARAPPRPRGRAGGVRLGPGDRRLRLRRRALARAAVPRGRRAAWTRSRACSAA